MHGKGLTPVSSRRQIWGMSKLHVNKAGPSILNPANHPVHITAAVQGRDLPKGRAAEVVWSAQAELHPHGQVCRFRNALAQGSWTSTGLDGTVGNEILYANMHCAAASAAAARSETGLPLSATSSEQGHYIASPRTDRQRPISEAH